MIICLILLLPAASSDPPENNPGQIIVLHSVLLRVRFTWHSLLPENRWALTPPFHPYWHKPAVYLCCTIFGVTSTGRYPAPCPVKPGLSSPASLRIAAATICPTQNLFILAYIYFDVQTCVYIFFVTAFTDNVHMDAHSYENATEKTDTTTRLGSFPQ